MRIRLLVTLSVLALAAAACTSGQDPSRGARSGSLSPGSVLLTGAGGPLVIQVPSGSVVFDGQGGVSSLGGRWLLEPTGEGRGTELETRDATTGDLVATIHVHGAFEPTVVSESGRAVALTDPLPGGWDPAVPFPRSSTRIVVADPTGATEARSFELTGNFEPEAFSVGDDRLFLLQYLPAETPRAYRVTMLDLATGKVRPVVGPFKGPAERMPGIRLEQRLAPDATQLYTLYSSAKPGYTPHEPPSDDGRVVSFVHVLSLRDGWAHCIGLPKAFWNRPASEQAMAVSPDGRHLYIVDATLGEIAVMDTESLQVRSGDVDLRVRGIDHTSATMSLDGRTLYVATSRGSSTVSAIDVATFDVLDRWSLETSITGLGLSSDGEHLLAATADGLEIIDVATGHEVGAVDVRSPEPVTRVIAFSG